MIDNIKKEFKKYWELIASGFLWCCLWATYNTDITRLFVTGFPHSSLDLMHGIRSLLPSVAIILAVVFLARTRNLPKNFLLTPLGLLGIYTAVGIFSSIFSKNPLLALYWGVLYGSVILVLIAIVSGAEPLKKLFTIININWIIAGIITFGLVVFFFAHLNVAHSLTNNFLICSQRPFEGLGGVKVQTQTLGMVGTRPTGLGRYAGIIAIVAFAGFLCSKNKLKNKAAWFVLFILFLLALFFSKGRTEILGFLVAMGFIIWISKKISAKLFLGAGLIFMLGIFSVFYSVPCTNYKLSDFFPKSVVSVKTSSVIVPDDIVAATPAVSLRDNVITLSGRTTGVWQGVWHLFLKDPLLGFGFQADRFFLNGQHAHNSLLHALIQAGILGTAPFLLAFILTLIILVRLLKNPKITLNQRNFLIIISGALAFLVVRGITESIAFFSADWLFAVPIIAYIQCLDDQLNQARNVSEEDLTLDFFGNKVNVITLKGAVEKMAGWIKSEYSRAHWIIVTGMHGVVEAEKHASFKYVISNADLFAPDGISLVWLARLKGFDIKKRVCGADLMAEFFRVAEKEGFTNYFYGDTDETLSALNKKLSGDFRKLKITGSYSPPFRQLTKEEDEKIIEKINQANPDVLWVALGLPKQEKWIFEHREKLNARVVVGIGAALKFLSGKVERSPKWIGDAGFEWLWRLLHEPKTTWKRVFVDIPVFLWLVFLDLSGFG